MLRSEKLNFSMKCFQLSGPSFCLTSSLVWKSKQSHLSPKAEYMSFRGKYNVDLLTSSLNFE